MPQTGDGNDVERLGGRRRIGALEDLREELAEERSLPRDERTRGRIGQLRDEIRQAERLLEAEQAEDTAEAATRTFDDLSPSEKREITRGLNRIGYKQPKRAEDLKNELVALPKEDRKAVIDEVAARRPKK